MKTVGFDKPLYTLPFDHRGSFQTKMFGWSGALSPDQTAKIAATKDVIYDAFRAALSAGVPEERAGILVDEQFGSAILRNARSHGYRQPVPPKKAVKTNSISSTGRISHSTSSSFGPHSAKSWSDSTPKRILHSMRGRQRV
jgi:hypothetical protein